jgi:hypothetical protein
MRSPGLTASAAGWSLVDAGFLRAVAMRESPGAVQQILADLDGVPERVYLGSPMKKRGAVMR